MGWGRMMLLGNWGQQMDIEDQRKELQDLRSEISRQRGPASSDLESLERENSELRLYLAAIIRYLIAKGTVDMDEFRVLVDEIDQGDGRQDGGLQGKVL